MSLANSEENLPKDFGTITMSEPGESEREKIYTVIFWSILVQ